MLKDAPAIAIYGFESGDSTVNTPNLGEVAKESTYD